MTNKRIYYPRGIFREKLALGLIKKYIPEHAKFLEIGCGSGDFGVALSQAGFYGKMIDFSEIAAQAVAENLKKNNIKNLQFEKGDIFDFQHKEQFDLAVLFEVLEHIEEDKKALDRINSLLKTNGFLLMSVPAKMEHWGSVDMLAGHFRRYEKDGLRKLLNETGFEVLTLYSYGFPFLNIIKVFRNYLIERALSKKGHKTKAEATKLSGLITPDTLNLPPFFKHIFKYIFNIYTLYPLIQFSKLFNGFDLAEGYLCLAKKYEKK